MTERRFGCGAGIVVLLILAGLYGFLTGDDPGATGVRIEVTLSAATARTITGPGCDPAGMALVVEAGSGGAQTVQMDRGEATAAGGCTFTAGVDLPDADRYRVTVPGTDLPARTVSRGVIDGRAPDGTVDLVLRVSW